MEPILRLAALASSIAQSTTEPSHVVSFLLVVLVLSLMAVVWRLLHPSRPQLVRTRRRR